MNHLLRYAGDHPAEREVGVERDAEEAVPRRQQVARAERSLPRLVPHAGR